MSKNTFIQVLEIVLLKFGIRILFKILQLLEGTDISYREFVLMIQIYIVVL